MIYGSQQVFEKEIRAGPSLYLYVATGTVTTPSFAFDTSETKIYPFICFGNL